MKTSLIKEEVQKLINISFSKSDACKNLSLSINGRGFRELEEIIKRFDINIEHFNRGYDKRKIKYPIVEKKCPVCQTTFKTKQGAKKEKETCSYSCSNSFFRSGESHPNWKESSYRSTCFLYHEKKCVICGEDKILDVHHYDENHKNNSPENLIPLCPTHHAYWHSRFKLLVEEKINEYKNNFIKK